MTDDIKAIRDALAEVHFYKAGGFSYNAHEFQIAANPLRIARLLDALEQAQKDAERYRWLRERHNVLCRMSTAKGLGLDLSAIYVRSTEQFDGVIDAAMKESP